MCGVAGIVSHDARVSYVIYFLLFALQHRGQEAAGIGTEQNGNIYLSKGMGTIDWVFRKRIPAEDMIDFVRGRNDMPRDELVEATHVFEQDPENEKAALAKLLGNAAIGHVRYSTTGASGNKNNHPILFDYQGKSGLIAHNGNLVRLQKLRDVIEARGGYNFEGTTDTELIAALIATSSQQTFYDALLEILPLLEGAFSLVLLYEGTVYAVKDKFGIRPLCIGKSANAYMVASETCALDIAEAEFLKELDPGEGAILRADGVEYFQWCHDSQRRTCLFEEAVYFSRPDSGRAYEIRKAAGKRLAQRAPVYHADKVFPVPDSGGPGAAGYGEELSLQVGKFLPSSGIVRSHFVGRTFIEVVLELRHEYRRIKYNPIRSEVEGKVVVIVDDSLIRGTTIPYIVALLKRLGAKEVHVRIVAPPSRYGCHLGVDLPYDWELVANNRTEEEVRLEINRLAREMSREAEETEGGTEVGEALDSLAYLPLADLLEATGLPPDSFCTGCFDKNWPVPREEESYDPKAV